MRLAARRGATRATRRSVGGDSRGDSSKRNACQGPESRQAGIQSVKKRSDSKFEAFKNEMNQKISYLAIENEILKQEIFQLIKEKYENEPPVSQKNLQQSSFFLGKKKIQNL